MSMHLGGPSSLKQDINVTPMIDLLLVLIIIFMIIQPRERGLNSEVPQNSPKDDKAPPPVKTVVLEIRAGGDGRPVMRINENEISREKLESTLRDIYSSRTEKIMFVKADPQLEFFTVAEVIDITRAADPAIRVGLVTSDFHSAD